MSLSLIFTDDSTGRLSSFIVSNCSVPFLLNPSLMATPSLQSRDLPLTNGPRSVTVTTTLLLLTGLMSKSLVPKGRVLWATVKAILMYGLPLAIVLPLSSPYQLEFMYSPPDTGPRTSGLEAIRGIVPILRNNVIKDIFTKV